MASAADVIAARLAEAGCRHAFGIPGGEVLAMMDALERAGVTFHLCRHENAGGFMAEGTWHATGAPGVLLATVGPGVVNAINTVTNAWLDQVPLVFLTGCIDAGDAVTFTHQVFDHRSVVAPIVKASMTAEAGAIEQQIDKLVSIALDGPPGPVHLDIPIAVAKAEVSALTGLRRAQPARTQPSTAGLAAAREALAKAERPLMIAGMEVLQHGAEAAVRAFCEAHQVPLLTTYKAKGLLPEDHALSLGGHGLSPKSFGILKPLIDAADALLLAGYDPIEMRSEWTNAWDPREKTVIELSSRPNTHFVYQATQHLAGDVGEALSHLSDGLRFARTWPDGAPAKTKEALAAAFPTGEDWGPAAVIDEVRKGFPDDGIVTVDTGAHRILISQQWPCRQPRTMFQSTALCTMGYAMPAAMGVKLAEPGRAALAFTGDGGLEMVLGELATARDLKVPAIVVVFVDESLALIELKQRRDQLSNVGVDFGLTDFAKVADALDGVGVTARDRASLRAALATALASDRLTVIACPIGRKAYDGRF